MAYSPRTFTKQIWDEDTQAWVLHTRVADSIGEDVGLVFDGWTPGVILPVEPIFTAQELQELLTKFVGRLELADLADPEAVAGFITSEVVTAATSALAASAEAEVAAAQAATDAAAAQTALAAIGAAIGTAATDAATAAALALQAELADQAAATAADAAAASSAASAAAASALTATTAAVNAASGAVAAAETELAGYVTDAQNAILSEITEAHLAARQGFWEIISPTPPVGVETMYGVPVFWVNSAPTVNAISVNPPAPTWDDALSKIVVPSGIVGVDYVHTSGGGGVGDTLLQGDSATTSGTFPRSVVITPVAKPGYQLATSGITFKHDFPDPAAITLLTSDGFSGTMTTLANRDTDISLGGTSQKWAPAVSLASANTLLLDGDGRLKFAPATVGDNSIFQTFLLTHNVQVEFDLLGLPTTGGNSSPLNIQVLRRVASSGIQHAGLSMLLGSDRYRIQTGNNSGGAIDLQAGISTVPPLGTYKITMYQQTITIDQPSGSDKVYDLSDSVTYKFATNTTFNECIFSIAVLGAPAGVLLIDNLKISKMGF